MSRLVANSTPAERAVGCSFAERFRSAAEIAENGGSLVGSVASYLSHANVRSVIAMLKEVSGSSQTVKINAGQTITIAAGSLFGSHTNATPFDADDIQVDDYTLFDFVKIFRSELDTQTLTDFENQTTYNYPNDALVHLPMQAAQHDPTNGRTLDISGNGNHAGFGDQVTPATYPTKTAGRGYETDGNDTLRSAAGLFTDTGLLTMACLVDLPDLVTTMAFAEYGEGVADVGGLFLIVPISNQVRFYCGSDATAASAIVSLGPSAFKKTSLIGVHDGTDTLLYIDGVLRASAGSPVAPGVTASMRLALFNRSNFVSNPSPAGSRFLEFEMHRSALTPLQVADLHINMLKRINRV